MKTPPINRVLVPSDFSEASLQALSKARAIAPDADVLLLHVEPPIDSVTGNVIASATQILASKEQTLAKLREAAGTEVSCEVRFGDAAGEIVWAAAEWGADLIVMPARSHGAIKHALLGSVTDRVLRSAKCPVLVLPAAS